MLIGTTVAAGRMDKTTTQQQPQFDTESVAKESVGDATAAVQPLVEDRLDDSESVPSGELGDPVEQQTQLGTTDRVPSQQEVSLTKSPPQIPLKIKHNSAQMISCRSKTLQLLEESKRRQGPLPKLELSGLVSSGKSLMNPHNIKPSSALEV